MKLKDAVLECITKRDATMAGRIADILRFRAGMNYKQSYAFINNIAPISPADWDEMLYCCDQCENYG